MKENTNKIKCIIKIVLSVILLLIPLFVIRYEKNGMSVQNTYLRWDSRGKSTHISVFMTENASFGVNNAYELEESVNNALLENDALDTKNGGRSWADCYSGSGKVTIENGSTNMETEAMGVGGDFFLFHPLQLLSGSYFSDDNIMKDLVVIDEDIAWRMFGSVDVNGMELDINGEKHIISGVIKRDDGRLSKAAGNDLPVIYMSYESLGKLSDKLAITSYEIVMPNLTKNYAYKLIKEKLNPDDKNYEIVDNAERFSIVALFKVVKEFDTRSMKTNKVCYPYWENIARGKENICALWLVIEIIILFIIILVLIKNIIRFYRMNAVTISEKWGSFKELVKELPYRCVAVVRQRKNNNMEYMGTVIFDIGNVLAEFIPREYLERKGYRGKKNKQLIESIIETDIWNEYDKGIMTKEEVINKFIEKEPALEEDIENIFQDLSGIVKKCEYTDKWIEELKEENIRVLFLSNISEALYKDCKDELDFIEKMDGGILSFEAKCIKPDKEIYSMIIKRYNLTAQRCIFVDDRQVNIESGRQEGLNTVLFTSYDEANEKIKEIIQQWK